METFALLRYLTMLSPPAGAHGEGRGAARPGVRV